MSIIDEIKIPFQTDDDLIELINFYIKIKDRNFNMLYSEFIGAEDTTNSYEKYEDLFKKYISAFYYNKLWNYLKGLNLKRHDYYVKCFIEKVNDIDQIEKIKENCFYPLSEYFEILRMFDSYEDFYICKCKCAEVINNPKRMNSASKSQQEAVRKIIHFSTLIRDKFRFDGASGFHVTSNTFDFTLKPKKREDEMKLYLNAGIDTFLVARLFYEKCVDKGYDYYFKVTDADDRTEINRNDRMCIYSELDDLEKYLEIVREIISENPQIKFRRGSILLGYIDDVIGIGTDSVGANRNSYNSIMSEVCFEALEELFKNIPTSNVMNTVNDNPEILNVLRLKIKEKASKMGLNYDLLCLKESTLQKINNFGNKF